MQHCTMTDSKAPHLGGMIDAMSHSVRFKKIIDESTITRLQAGLPLVTSIEGNVLYKGEDLQAN